MSEEDLAAPRSRSASPSSSLSESDPDDNLGMLGAAARPYTKLIDIKTLATLYNSAVLKPATKVEFQPNPSLLDRVSLLCVPPRAFQIPKDHDACSVKAILHV